MIGDSGAADYDRVEYTYDKQGEVTEMEDQNGTIHEYIYDQLGREIEDKILQFGAGVDQSVKEIDYGYDLYGNLATVTSKDASGNVVNEVYDQYNSLGELVKEYQNPVGGFNVNLTTGQVTGDTLATTYNYDPARV